MGLTMLEITGRETPDPRTPSSLYAEPLRVDDPGECFFYHTVDLPGFGLQDGAWDLRGRSADYIGGVDLAGKRVLDVGTASGFLSFEAERQGAREVVSFDLATAERQPLLPFAGSAYVEDHAAWCRAQTAGFMAWKRGYWLSHRLLGSRARAVYGDVYDPPAGLGRFDVVILGAILEHLVDPLSALTAVAALTDDLVVINTDFFESPERVAVFKGRADLPMQSYVFWTYSIPLYHEYMAIMGFEPAAVRKDSFAGTRPHPGAERPMLARVALVYRRIDAKGSRAR